VDFSPGVEQSPDAIVCGPAATDQASELAQRSLPIVRVDEIAQRTAEELSRCASEQLA
jgi:hypothetical protein